MWSQQQLGFIQDHPDEYQDSVSLKTSSPQRDAPTTTTTDHHPNGDEHISTGDSRMDNQSTSITPIHNNNDDTTTLTLPSRHHFWTDQTHVQQQLVAIETRTLSRRHEHDAQLQQLHWRLAELTARLAQHHMDRDAAVHAFPHHAVTRPLQDMLERFDLAHTHTLGQWSTLERRLTQFDASMTHAFHVQLDMAEQLQNYYPTVAGLLQQWQSATALSDKRWASIVSQYETLAGTMARRYQQERAARVAMVQVVSSTREKLSAVDVEQGEVLGRRLVELREQIRAERTERRERDEQLRNAIEQRTSQLKRAILTTLAVDENSH